MIQLSPGPEVIPFSAKRASDPHMHLSNAEILQIELALSNAASWIITGTVRSLDNVQIVLSWSAQKSENFLDEKGMGTSHLQNASARTTWPLLI